MMAVMDRNGSVEVSLFEVVVLKRHDGRGVGVGIEVVGGIANHAAKVGEKIGRENVLIRDDAHGFEITGGLELAGGLLNLFIGKLEARKRVAHAKAEMVFGRERAGEGEHEIASGAAVSEVFWDNRIEIVGSAIAGGAEAEGIVSGGVLELGESTGR